LKCHAFFLSAPSKGLWLGADVDAVSCIRGLNSLGRVHSPSFFVFQSPLMLVPFTAHRMRLAGIIIALAAVSAQADLPYKIDTHHHFVPVSYRAGSLALLSNPTSKSKSKITRH
jgi:hypothetical protein